MIDKEVRAVVAQVIREYEFRGSLPPPSIMKGYEELLPGSADRIHKMAERQSEHRQSLERKMVQSESRDSLLGVICAFGIGIGALAAAVIIAVNVPDNAGAICAALLGATGIGSITASFLKTTRSSYSKNSKQIENRDNDMEEQEK